MKQINVDVGGVAVRWMRQADAPEIVAEFCVRAGLAESSFPSAKRLRTLMGRCTDIILGVYAPAVDGTSAQLVGVAVVLPLTRETATQLNEGHIDSGKKIGTNELRRSWPPGMKGTDVYVSVLAADASHWAQVVEAAARVLVVLQGSRSAFTRASTANGRAASTRLGFSPIPATRTSIWVKSPATGSAERRRGRRRRTRSLAVYDKRLRMISTVVSIARPVLILLYVAAVLTLALCVLIPGPASTTLVGFLNLDPPKITPIITTAATLGGLALTVFFLTAQLRLAGIRQYGVTAIYRVRDIVPLVGLTGLTVLLGVFAIVFNQTASPTVILIIAGIAVLSHAFLILFIALLSIELIRNLDPVAVARRFAFRLRGPDAAEWGLVKVRQATGHVTLGVELQKNRTNFGLRDPLMPIHEIHLTSIPQRYGQVLSVMAEQIARAYGCRWRAQYPDVAAWRLTVGQGAWRRTRAWLRSFRVKRGWDAERDRLQLAMLLLHYFRRIHRNGALEINADYRRQSALFVMSRLIVVLASDINRSRVSTEESALLLRLCLDVVLRIGSDYAVRPDPGVMAKHCPRIENELFRAFPAAIAALAENGYLALATDAAHTARWLMNSGAIERSRLLGFTESLQKHRYLVRILDDEVGMALPSFVSDSPWGSKVPDPLPSH